jgi:general secretion pathway protein L
MGDRIASCAGVKVSTFENPGISITSMAIALAPQLNQLRARVRGSQVGHFFAWWLSELRELLPPGWRAHLLQAQRALVMRVSAIELVLAVRELDARHELARFPLEEDPRLHQQKLRAILVERELLEVPRELLLDEEEVLRREVVLPLAAEGGLRQALAYEMDRQTPFRADEVYFSSRTLRRDRDAGQLRVELMLTPRERLDRQLELLTARGVAPSVVDVATEEGPAGVNLLPRVMRYQVANWRVRFNWALGGIFLLLLAGVMTQSLWLRQHQIAETEAAIESVREEAMRVQQIRQQIDDAQEAAGFMGSRRAESLPTVKVIAEVTRVLPDDTYLDRLMVGEGTVQMQGQSSNAQRLIEMVNQSGYFGEAAFRGPTRLDSRTQREVFDLAATIENGGED